MHTTILTFKVKRLLDVFLYTQYAHQPDERRQRQFLECLQEVKGRRGFMTWMFLTEIWKCSLDIVRAGRVIAGWFQRYCNQHGITPDVLNSLRNEHAGLGAVEKEEVRKARLFREKAEELATELWKQQGCPERGPMPFLPLARKQLAAQLRGDEAGT